MVKGVPVCVHTVLGSMPKAEKNKQKSENPSELSMNSQFTNLKMNGLNKCLVLNPFGSGS